MTLVQTRIIPSAKYDSLPWGLHGHGANADDSQKPVIFIAHSMGGLVVKQVRDPSLLSDNDTEQDN